jgi:hypothetical protein
VPLDNDGHIILHRFDFEQKLNVQNAEIIDPAAETPSDSVSAPYAVKGLQFGTPSVSRDRGATVSSSVLASGRPEAAS